MSYRRTKRPDQALYVPGALRQAKKEKQEQSLSKEAPTNNLRVDNQEIFSNNLASVEPDGVPSDITGSTPNDVSDCTKSDKGRKEICEPRTGESSAVDVLEETGSLSSDGHKQHVKMQSDFSADELPIKEDIEAQRQSMLRRDVDLVVADNSRMGVVAEAPNTLHIRDERVERNSKDSVTVDQSFDKESANSEAVSSEHTSDEGDTCTENSQACISTYTLSNYGVAEKVSRAASENSEDSNDKFLKVGESLKEQDQGGNHGDVMSREASDLEDHSFQDHSFLKGNEDFILKMDTKNESMLTEHEELKGSDLPEVSVGDGSDCQSGEKLVGQVESCTESDLIMSKGDSVNIESGEVLAVCGAGSDCLNLQEKQGEDKEVTCEQVSLDILHPACLIDNGKFESQNNATGLSNSSEKIDESDSQLGKTEEEIQVLSDYTKGSSESAVVESNQSIVELEAELPKALSSKKKKSKKEKCKEGEEKTKSKGKSEKKKRKEKKGDNEQIIDSGKKLKEEKKPRSKEPCTKEQKKKDLNTKQELLTEKKGVGANDCTDGSGGGDGDDDNWELNFDESGDCLKPEHLEEVCFVDSHAETTSTTYIKIMIIIIVHCTSIFNCEQSLFHSKIRRDECKKN